jgi:hypothetical protein
MLPPGSIRQRLARALNAAHAEGVLSQNTLVHRLDLLFTGPLVDPARVVGDLSARRSGGFPASAIRQMRAAGRRAFMPNGSASTGTPVLLALDWDGGHETLLIGRDPSCDIVFSGPAVSRRHAQLTYSDGIWTLEDLDSTNGTGVNGAPVGRCKLKPGDRVVIGDVQLLVD